MIFYKEDIFNRVAEHLLTQSAKAESSDGTCRYLVPETGQKCAVGCLIKPKYYSPSLEGNVLSSSKFEAVTQALNASGIPVNDPEVFTLLRALQRIHDGFPVKDWLNMLWAIAYALDFSFLQEFVWNKEEQRYDRQSYYKVITHKPIQK